MISLLGHPQFYNMFYAFHLTKCKTNNFQKKMLRAIILEDLRKFVTKNMKYYEKCIQIST